eukprot:6327272-Heterocapsa_arctica.AAC.1
MGEIISPKEENIKAREELWKRLWKSLVDDKMLESAPVERLDIEDEKKKLEEPKADIDSHTKIMKD